MTPGQLVHITAQDLGSITAKVEGIQSSYPLWEHGVDRWVMFSYRDKGKLSILTAFQRNGHWTDLTDRPLLITEVVN